MNNLERFFEEYAKALEYAIAKNPQLYSPKAIAAPREFARKMTLALSSGQAAIIGPTTEFVCKKLGVRQSYKAIRAYFDQDLQLGGGVME
ncbi:MAG: hypothetical protein HYX63_01445 [Gammaproteobacteria bacterium]|nr:hypothetical protein [Gammaproteobacteria bacterium]